MLKGQWMAAAALLLAACGGADEERDEAADAMAETLSADLEQEMRSGRTPVEIKTANCLLWPSNFRGDCMFEPRGRGSFSVRLEGGDAFYDDVEEILVSVFLPGRADVRVLNRDGTSELLGEAQRSETYPACWIGTGFSVCAY